MSAWNLLKWCFKIKKDGSICNYGVDLDCKVIGPFYFSVGLGWGGKGWLWWWGHLVSGGYTLLSIFVTFLHFFKVVGLNWKTEKETNLSTWKVVWHMLGIDLIKLPSMFFFFPPSPRETSPLWVHLGIEL